MTTSFTINYDEKTISSFIDGMAERNIPLRVFHFDCYWMKAFHCTGNRLLPVFVRENTVLAMGENDQLPDYEYAENVVLHLFEIKDGAKITTEVTDVSGKTVLVANTKREGNTVSVAVDHPQYHPSVMVHGMTGVAIQTELEVNYTDKGVI